jgi:hypothetical protein
MRDFRAISLVKPGLQSLVPYGVGFVLVSPGRLSIRHLFWYSFYVIPKIRSLKEEALFASLQRPPEFVKNLIAPDFKTIAIYS